MEKVKKIILVILLIATLALNVNAYPNPPLVVAGNIYESNTASGIDYLTVKTYDYLEQVDVNFEDESASTLLAFNPFLAIYQSSLYPNSINRLTITFDNQDIFDGTGEVGDIANISLVDSEIFGNLTVDPNYYQNITVPYGSLQKYYPADNREIFYDNTSKQLSILFYISEDYYNENMIDMLHTYIVVNFPVIRSWDYRTVSIDVESYTGVKTYGIYTDILNQIHDKMEGLTGGGITKEEITEAIEDALNAHDQQLEQEVGSKLNQILEQIGGVTEPYKQAVDQITGTLANVSNIFAYSGTDAVLTLPAAVNPLAGNAVLWQAQQIDLGAAYNTMPSSLRILLQYALRAAVLLAVVNEVINIIKYAIIGRGDRVD